MPDHAPGFLAAHAARGSRSVLRLGLALTLVGAGLSGLFASPYGFIFIGTPGVIALGFWAWRRLRPATHSVYTQLARYGDGHAMAEEVEREFAGAAIDERPHFGARWLAQGDTYGVHLVPWHAVAWFHLVEKRGNGFVVGYQVRVLTADGRMFTMPVGSPPEEQHDLLTQLHAHAPWAEVGFSPERQKEWDAQRDAVLARVEARRAAVETARLAA